MHSEIDTQSTFRIDAKRKVFRAITYRLHPTSKGQWELLLLLCRACRFAYNEALRQVQEEYKDGGKPSLSFFSLGKRFTVMRNSALNTWLLGVSYRVVSYEMKNLSEAFKKFFAGASRFPRFKSVRRDRQSFTVPFQNTQDWIKKRHLKVPKVGWLRLSGRNRYRQAVAKQATVYMEAGKWYASVLYEMPDELPADTGLIVGVDRNAGQVTLSDGQVFRMPDRSKADKNIRRYQRDLARKRRAAKVEDRKFWESARYRRTQEKLQKWCRIARHQARDWAHQTSRTIADLASHVAVEDLRVQPMVRKGRGKRKLNRSIMASGWGKMVEYLSYKCRQLVKVNPAYTSLHLQPVRECGQEESPQSVTVCLY